MGYNTFEFLHCNLEKMLQVCVIFLCNNFSLMQLWQNVANLSHLCRTTIFQVCLNNAPMKIHGLKDNNVSSLLKECSNENSWDNNFGFLHCNFGKNAASLSHLCIATIFSSMQFRQNVASLSHLCRTTIFQVCLKNASMKIHGLKDNNVSS